jgi:uncharacterized protein YndB with AHSA1/START domain
MEKGAISKSNPGRAGAPSTMAKAEYVIEPGKHEIIITRVFDAPRELVFKAFTDPKMVEQWFGPREYTTKVDKLDARPGGLWRFVQSDGKGNEFGFHGVHHDVNAPESVVSTFEFEGAPGHVAMQTVNLEPMGNKTRMVEQLLFQSVTDRDGMVASGMQRGSDDSMDRLAELLVES